MTRVRAGQSDGYLRLPGRAVLTIGVNGSAFSFTGRQVPASKQTFTRSTGNVRKGVVHGDHAGQLDFAIAVLRPYRVRIVRRPGTRTVRMIIAKSGLLQPVARG